MAHLINTLMQTQSRHMHPGEANPTPFTSVPELAQAIYPILPGGPGSAVYVQEAETPRQKLKSGD